MLTITYPLPFSFEVSVGNPWDGRRPVALAVQGATALDERSLARLRERLAPFWSLGDAGGLAGTAVEPWRSRCHEPTIFLQQGIAHLAFDPCTFDERATHCLLCLLLALHVEIPVARVVLSAPGSACWPPAFDPDLDDPYPGLWPQLPFACEVEDSESETRVLRAQLATAPSEEQARAVHHELMRWGTAAAEGAYGIAPVEPRGCSCLPVNPLELDENELTWPVEKCRFHDASYRALIAVCASIHHRVVRLVDLVVE